MIGIPEQGEADTALTQGTAQLTRGQWWVLGTMIVAGAAGWCASEMLGGDWRALGLFGVFLVVYAAVVVAGGLPYRIVSARLDTLLDRWVRDKSGKGFYGMVALSVLAWQELAGLLDFGGSAFDVNQMVKSQITHYIIGFSIDAMAHAIHASIWPWWLIGELGLPGTALFMGASWAVFAFGRNHLPMPDLFKKPNSGETMPEGEAKASSGPASESPP